MSIFRTFWSILAPRAPVGIAILLGAPLLPACTADVDDGERWEQESLSDEDVGQTEEAIFGSNTCKNADIFIGNVRERNNVGTAIWIHKVEYYSWDKDDWYTENVSNEVVDFEYGITYPNRNLEKVKGDLITKWRVHYKYADNGVWSNLVAQTDNTTDTTCNDNTLFEMYVE